MTKTTPVTAYPLCWPEGWPRTPEHKRDGGARFKGGDIYEGYGDQRRYVGRRMISFDAARRSLADELSRLNATGITLSTNVELRLDGDPRAGAVRSQMDPGVAVYFTVKGKPMVMARDYFSGIAANMRSLALAIEALRQLERHGGGTMMERAFAGFSALPPPENAAPSKRPWWEVMRFPVDPAERELLSAAEINARFSTLAKKLHPDAGGSTADMSELNVARADALEEIEQ